METQKKEAKQIILNGKPRVDDFENLLDYLDAQVKFEEAVQVFVDERFTLNECKRVLKLADDINKMEQEDEDEYADAYYEARDKARKILESGILKRENKIKALEKEIEELSNMTYDIKHSDFSCLRIHYSFEVMDRVKKEEKKREGQ